MTDPHPLEVRVGYRFDDPSILRQALTHSTYANEHPDEGDHNERLEFLGDAVVGLLVADMLFEDLDQAHEGLLTKRRARVVRREGLAKIARQLELGTHLKLGQGQRRAGGEDSDRLLADALEAFVAALFRDGGMAVVRRTVGPLFADALSERSKRLDFKTTLQERAHALGQAPPDYRVVDISGPDHARTYQVEVAIAGAVRGRGRGSSKKAAEQAAAEIALNGFEETA